MSNTFAYRASTELATALRDISERILEFNADVIIPWERNNPGVTSIWIRRLGYEIEYIGFRVDRTKTADNRFPEGLSANRERPYLIPRRGRSGDQWRKALEQINQRPKLGPVLRQFGVEPTIMVIDHGRRYTPGLCDTKGAYYLTWGHEHPDPGPHLTPVPLSEYYLAVEAAEEDKEVSSR